MERFGKPSAPLLDARGHLLTVDGNDALVARTQRIYECYRRQPKRLVCKVCEHALEPSPIFVKFDIPYFLCTSCGHFNGGFEDTPEFNAFLYTGDASAGMTADYREETREAYFRRVEDIYAAKAAFLFDAIASAGENAADLRHADLGAGSGYFVAALKAAGVPQPVGYDVSPDQIELGNRMLGEPLLRGHGMDELYRLAATVEADVVSLIFTLEHLERPRDLMAALSANPHVRFVMIAVPTVCPTMFFELVFPTVFERHLSAHTHVFSDGSLRWLAEHAGFERSAEWWFGSDAMDVFRDVAIRMGQTGQGDAAQRMWTDLMRPLIDDWQLAVDRRKLSSAVHLVLRKT
ncbi:methyltransferase domain-containing protein [Tardiphaga sp. vice278]|uniref:methyltransferase domain-containing protein n=1 Tax=Tardiphaga sp. vice278 TaxID=2592815 RepID=UPI00143DB5E4|nr:methyltransferase domain-containing protein [Tardiphaga sp. vice278]